MISLDLISGVFLFAFGSVIGSFLNVVALRFIAREEIVKTPSHCVACGKRLFWYELIPVVSFLFQLGKCRGCNTRISWQYPLVELAMAVSALYVFLPFYTSPYTLVQQILIFTAISLLLVLWVIDTRTFLLPDIFIGGLAIVAIAYRISQGNIQGVIDGILGLLIASGFLYLLWIVTNKQGIGFGDIKLMIPVGFLLGMQGSIVTLFAAFVIGGMWASYLVFTKKATMKTAVPFGPYLAGVAIVCLSNPYIVTYLTSFLGWPLGMIQ